MARQGAQTGSSPMGTAGDALTQMGAGQQKPNVGAPSTGGGQKGALGSATQRPAQFPAQGVKAVPYQSGLNAQTPQQGNPTNPQMMNMYQMQKTLGQQQGPVGFGTPSGLTPERLRFLQQFGLPAG